MKKIALSTLLASSLCFALPLRAEEAPVLSQPGPANEMLFNHLHPETKTPEKPYPLIDLKVGGIDDGKIIPEKFAYCKPDGKGSTINADNISPAIHWLNAPEATKSLVLLVVDPDVPADFTDANKQGKEIPAQSPRQDFYHWVLTDIPPSLLGLYEGADSHDITPGGKQVGKRSYGVNGKNDYAKVFTGTYGGYDGPCPPWNDLRLHHYHFILYALDVPSLNLPNPITGLQVKSSMEGHIIAKGEVTGTYTNNTRWLNQLRNDANKVQELVPGERFEPEKK